MGENAHNVNRTNREGHTRRISHFLSMFSLKIIIAWVSPAAFCFIRMRGGMVIVFDLVYCFPRLREIINGYGRPTTSQLGGYDAVAKGLPEMYVRNRY